jgi:hypothetical protein
VPDWKIDGVTVAFPNHMASRSSSNLNELHVNVTKSVDISCFVLLYENGQVIDRIPSKNLVTVTPRNLPEMPVSKNFAIKSKEVELMLDHNSVCFDKHTFYPEVCLSQTSVHKMVKRSFMYCNDEHFNESLTIDNLSAGKSYTVAVTAVCQEESDIRSQPLIIDFTTQSEGSQSVASPILCVIIVCDFLGLLLSFYL